MRVINVMFDSLNRHMLEPYGCTWTKTPNFSRLAQRSATFDNCYAGSLPCMPARRELHTGRINFLHRSWGPIEPYDDSVPEILKNHGVYSHLISDHQHYWEDGGCTYHSRYNSWEIVRGQEGDVWKGQVKDPEIPEHYGRFWRQDAVNRAYLQNESQQPQTLCFDLGLEFIEKNLAENDWFVQIETFDPHEPFYSMENYKKLYPHYYDGPVFDWPEYKKVTEPPEAVEHVRCEYAALLSMCDHSLGRILDFMDLHDMWKDTMLIVNTDHGFLLGEHDMWAKCVHPFYNENAHIPLFIWDPRLCMENVRRESLVQSIDIPATLLDFFGIPLPPDMQGKPLKSVIANDERIHDAVLFGMHGGQLNITDGRYVYMRNYAGEQNGPLFQYTHMPTHMRKMFQPEEMRTMQIQKPFNFTKGCPTMKIKHIPDPTSDIEIKEKYPDMLFDLANDPRQLRPIQNEDVQRRLVEKMINLMIENDAPHEQYERLGLPNPEVSAKPS